MKKSFLFLFLTILLYSLGSFGQTYTIDGIYYVITSPSTVEVSHDGNFYPNYTGEVIIPSTIVIDTITYSVTSIGDAAFFQCSSLTSITIPNSVSSIAYHTFGGCTGLTSFTIPNSVTSIGANAFYGCTGLTSFTIPNSVTSIGGGAFRDCTSLASVTIPNSITIINEQLFYGCTDLTSITIPNSVTSIGTEAFKGCYINSVIIPNSVTSIGSSAFYNCYGLTSITIPNSVTSIGNSAFFSCISLSSVSVSWATPLVISPTVFGALNLSTITLNVPAGTIALYDMASVWTNFNINTLGTDNFLKTKINFSPNPASSQITFSHEIFDLEIFDITGKIVKTFKNSSTNFDVSSVEKGIYLLKGKTIDGLIFNEKLIKE